MLIDSSKARCASFFLLVCLAAIVCGCSKSKKLDLTPVSGTVTLDGKPLPDADVTFFYQGSSINGYRISTGKTDAAGKYELKAGAQPGAVPGDFKVTVSRVVTKDGAAVKLEEGMDMTQLEMQGLAKQSLPEKYYDYEKTGLTAKVEKGKSEGYDFPLSSS
jgi:hypothetical protein